MSKNKLIGLKLTQAELDKVNTLKGEKSAQKFIRELIAQVGTEQKKETNEFVELLKRLEGINLDKIEGEIKAISTRLSESKQSGQTVKEMISSMQYMSAILMLQNTTTKQILQRDFPGLYKNITAKLS